MGRLARTMDWHDWDNVNDPRVWNVFYAIVEHEHIKSIDGILEPFKAQC